MRVSLVLLYVLASSVYVGGQGWSEEFNDKQRLRGLTAKDDAIYAQLHARAEKDFSSNDRTPSSSGSAHSGRQMKPKHMKPMHSKKNGKKKPPKMPPVGTMAPKVSDISPPPMISPATKAPSEQDTMPPMETPPIKQPKGMGGKGGKGNKGRVKGAKGKQAPGGKVSKPKGSMDIPSPKGEKAKEGKKRDNSSNDGEGTKSPDSDQGSSDEHEENLDIPQDAVERTLGLIAFAYNTTSLADPAQADYSELARVTQETFDYMFKTSFEKVEDVSYYDTNLRQYTVLAPFLVKFDISAYFKDDGATVVPTAFEAKQVAIKGFSSGSESSMRYVSELRLANSPGVFSNVHSVVFITDESELQKYQEQNGESPGDGSPSKAMLSAVIPLSAFAAVFLGIFGYAFVARKDRVIHAEDEMKAFDKKAADDDQSTTNCTYLTDCRTSVFSGDESTAQSSTFDYRLASSRSHDDEYLNLACNLETDVEGHTDNLEEVSLEDTDDLEQRVAEVNVSIIASSQQRAHVSEAKEKYEKLYREPSVVKNGDVVTEASVVEDKDMATEQSMSAGKGSKTTLATLLRVFNEKSDKICDAEEGEANTLVDSSKQFVPGKEVPKTRTEVETTSLQEETVLIQDCEKELETASSKRAAAALGLNEDSEHPQIDINTTVALTETAAEPLPSGLMQTQELNPPPSRNLKLKENTEDAHNTREKNAIHPRSTSGKPAWMTKREEIMASASNRNHDASTKSNASRNTENASSMPEWMQKFHEMGLRKESD